MSVPVLPDTIFMPIPAAEEWESSALIGNELNLIPRSWQKSYNCQMCGACDVSCKYAMDMEVLEPLYEMRIDFQEKSGNGPAILKKAAANLSQHGQMVPAPKNRTNTWFKNLDVKDYGDWEAEAGYKTGIIYHAGCRVSGDPEMWKIAQSNVKLLQKAGIDVGIARESEPCCGGRAYSMGFKKDFLAQAKANMEKFRKAGVKTLVTGCAECYQAFKVLYDKYDLKGDLEVFHTSEYFARLIQAGKLKPSKKINLKMTYHDPPSGETGGTLIHWKGSYPGHILIYDPPMNSGEAPAVFTNFLNVQRVFD
jgi:Fe-S oxidoreductase